MRTIYAATLTLATLLVLSQSEEASAQLYSRQIQAPQAITRVPVPTAPGARLYNRRPTKPFKHVQQRPTVSPYLNLTRVDAGSGNYQTLVRPQLEQMEFNRQQQVQLDRLGREFEDFEVRSAYPVGGSENIRATGHTTRYLNLSHYYPQSTR